MLLFNGSNQYGKAFILDTSIHPMLLLNNNLYFWKLLSYKLQYITCCYSTAIVFTLYVLVSNFNTSHVVIQPTKNRHSCILLISINHDLKPFLSYFTNHSIENQLFVRNHVFTPFDRLFQKITW